MILTYQAHKCSPQGICFTLSEYIPLVKVWTCVPILWSVGWGVSRRYWRSCSISHFHVFCVVIPVAIKYNPILKSTVKMLIFMLLFKIIITVLLNKEHFLSEFSMVNLKLIVKSHYLYYCHIMHHAFIIKLFWWSGINSLAPGRCGGNF